MKKLLLLPLLVLPLLTGCDGNKVEEKCRLTFGSKMQEGNEDAIKELSNSELLVKTRDQQEVFLLAVYQDRYSEDCLCWKTYKEVLKTYCYKYWGIVYTNNAHNQDETLSHLKIEKLNTSTPYLYIFNGEKLVKKFSHANNKQRKIFEDTSAEEMRTQITKYVDNPSLYYVDEENISKSEPQVVMFMRSGCSDCKYALEEVIIPYINYINICRPIFLFDMQKYYDLSKYPDASEEEKTYYQNLKNRYGLSEAEDNPFGYQQGVVPTIQCRDYSGVKAAAVYFNDVVDKREDGSYYISDSYYSEERKELPTEPYTFPNVLKGMTLKEGVIENNGKYYWSQKAANKYHKENFVAFLNAFNLGWNCLPEK